MSKYYKVVKVVDEEGCRLGRFEDDLYVCNLHDINVNYKFVSLVICYELYCSSLIVEYAIDKWTYPNLPGSQLMITNNLKRARWWAKQYNGIIFEVEVKNPRKDGLRIFASAFGSLNIQRLRKICKLKREHKRFLHLCHETYISKGLKYVSHSHTKHDYLASAVKLIKRVK